MKDIMEERENGVEINIMDLLVAYLRKWWLIAIGVGLTASVALLITLFCVTPKYQAVSSIYVNNNKIAGDKEYVSNSDLSASINLVKSYIKVTESNRVLEKAAAKLNGDYTAAQLKIMVNAKQIDETEIFGIYVIHEDPKEAARIANAVAEVAPNEINSIIVGSSANIIDPAEIPVARYSPSYTQSAVIGGAAGLLAVLVYLTIMYLKDTRIRDENDLIDMFEIPVLGRIPDYEYAVSGHHSNYEPEKKED